MAVLNTDIKFYLSGGAANSNPALSLGGIISSVEVTPATLWDNISSAEAAAGDTEYRCIYVKNTSGADTLLAAAAWVSSNTPSTSTTLDIGLGFAAINATETAVGAEGTAPSGPTFSAPASKAAGLVIGDMAAGAYKALWLRRTVTAGAAAYNNDGATINVGGDTGA
ncbi:MAG: hypothetical protein IPN62_16425 [Flavobacteriales bacterium]|nr:hypothetical protein [Flavobacteriales bacterium]